MAKVIPFAEILKRRTEAKARKGKGIRRRTRIRTKPKSATDRRYISDIRTRVFERANDICEICKRRRADSMHEVKFRSNGGKVSMENSIAVCGSGTTGCHGFAQRNEIVPHYTDGPVGWERGFVPTTEAARDWIHTRESMREESTA